MITYNTYSARGQHFALPATPYQYPANWYSRGTGQFHVNQNQILGQVTTNFTATPASNSSGVRITVQPAQAGGGTATTSTSPQNKLILCDCKSVPIPSAFLPYPAPPPCPPQQPKKKKKKNLCPLASKRYCSKPGCPLGFPQFPTPAVPDCMKTGTGQREHFIVTLLPEDKERFAAPSPQWLQTLPYPTFPCMTDRPAQWEEPEDGKGKKGKNSDGKEKSGKGKKK